MDCKDCSNRETCRKVCEDVERELSKSDHSLKSRYLVSFFDPQLLEVIAHIQKVKYGDVIHRRTFSLQNKKKLVILVKKLRRRQKKCVVYYYGLITGKPMTQEKIAKKLGVTQSNVSQILEAAIRRLRVMFRRK